MGLKDLLEGEVLKIAAIVLAGILGVTAITVALPWFVFTIPVWLLLLAGYWYVKG